MVQRQPTPTERLIDFLEQSQGVEITSFEVGVFQGFVRRVLAEQSETADDDYPYDRLLQDMLQLQSFHAMIPLRRLAVYMRVRRECYETQDNRKGPRLPPKRDPRFRMSYDDSDDGPWWNE